jgi:type III secretion protein L
MAVWFRTGRSDLGFDHGLIRRDEFARLLPLQDAAAAAQRDIELMMRFTKTQVRMMLEKARADSGKVLGQANDRFNRGYQRGYADGMKKAAADWADGVVRGALSDKQALERRTDRVAYLVTEAVQQVVENEDRQALYQRALRTVVKMVSDVPMLTLRVSEGEQERARRAIEEIAGQLDCKTPIEVVADASVRLGACLFESDQGSIDASLDTQLEAIRRAVERASRRMGTPGANDATAQSQDDAQSSGGPRAVA